MTPEEWLDDLAERMGVEPRKPYPEELVMMVRFGIDDPEVDMGSVAQKFVWGRESEDPCHGSVLAALMVARLEGE